MNTDIMQKLEKESTLSTVDESLLSSGSGLSEDEEDEMRKNKAMEMVFHNPGVIQIFERIVGDVKDLSDLKHCRLINKKWRDTTTKLMLKRNSTFVALKLDSRTLKHQKYQKFIDFYKDGYFNLSTSSYHLEDEEGVEDAESLTDLKETVDKSTQFPCSTFVIYRRKLRDLVMKDFFKVVGKSIKTLKLVRVNGRFVKFGEFLGLHCPNLETLYIEGGPSGEDQILWNSENISVELPKLQMLDIKDVNLFAQLGEGPFKILETLVSPNLQIIRGFHLWSDWEVVANAGKIQFVKELIFSAATDSNKLTTLEMFVQVGPQLESLNLDLWYPLDSDERSRWMRLIQKLLDLSKTALKSFNFYRIEDVFENLKFPKFPQLREIQLNSYTAEEGGVRYPYEILSDDICPNLQVIKGFNMSRDAKGVATAGKVYCVKKLYLDLYKHELEVLKLFLSGSPQLEILELHVALMDLDLKRELTCFLEKLLKLSKDTLRGFKFNGVGDVFQDITFPTFSKLEFFEVVALNQRIFIRGTNLTETFLKLETLDLHKCNFDENFRSDESWNKCFPPDAFTGSLTSVTTLIFNREFTDASKRSFQVMCPNAKVFYYRD